MPYWTTFYEIVNQSRLPFWAGFWLILPAALLLAASIWLYLRGVDGEGKGR